MSGLLTIDVFLSTEERELVEGAARNRGIDLIDYIRREAIAAAEMQVTGSRRQAGIKPDWKDNRSGGD